MSNPVTIAPRTRRPRRDPALLFRTGSGRDINMAHPDPNDLVWEDIAHQLSGEYRFGNVPVKRYSVAQHLVMGGRFCSPRARPYFRAHDAHEYTGDDPTPKKKARKVCLRETLEKSGSFTPDQIAAFVMAVDSADDEFEMRHMAATHIAAGLQWPVPLDIEREVKMVDWKMLLTEWRDLMPGLPPVAPKGMEDLQPFPVSIGKVWAPEEAREKLLLAFRADFPCFTGVPA